MARHYLKLTLTLIVLQLYGVTNYLRCEPLLDLQTDVENKTVLVNKDGKVNSYRLLDFGIVSLEETFSDTVTLINKVASAVYIKNRLSPYLWNNDPDNFLEDYNCPFCNSFYEFKSSTPPIEIGLGDSTNIVFSPKKDFDSKIRDSNSIVSVFFVTPVLDLDDEPIDITENSSRLILLTRISKKPLGTYRRFEIDRNGKALDTIHFDSLLANGNPVNRFWTMRNVDSMPVIVDSSRVIPISNNTCDNFDFSVNTVSFASRRDAQDIPITHQAYQNCGSSSAVSDTVIAEISYTNRGKHYHDSIVAVSNLVKFGPTFDSGTRNSLPLAIEDNRLLIDTLEVDTESSFSMIFRNDGKLPFPLDSVYFINVNGTIQIQDFTYSKGRIVEPQDTFSVNFTFKTKAAGSFGDLALVIDTGLEEGRFANQLQSDRFYIYSISGGVRGPTLSFIFDEIDFGEVVISGKCDPNVDTIAVAINESSRPMHIQLIGAPNSPFVISPIDRTLAPFDTLNIPINFFPTNEDEYSNTYFLLDTTTESKFPFTLRGKAVRNERINISSFDFKNKPGRDISLPIVFSNDRISLASEFYTTLEYNGSLLEFIGYNTNGTAAELLSGISQVGPERDSIGKKYIDLALIAESGSTFLNDTTLIELNFITYLGNEKSTEIRFIKPRFANSNCEDLFDLQFANSSYTLDSVIALEAKLFDKSETSLPVISNIIFKEANIEFDVEQGRDNLTIMMTDIYGRIVNSVELDLASELKVNTISIPWTHVFGQSAGVYFITFLWNNRAIESYKLVSDGF